jgi:indole-3-glycerol phosphate synthase
MFEQSFLDLIMAHKREEVARSEVKHPLAEVQARAEAAPPVRPFGQALRQPDRLRSSAPAPPGGCWSQTSTI